MNVLETVKDHPFYIVGALAVVFVGYVYLSTGSGADPGDGSTGDIYAAQNAAGDQMQAYQIGAQLQSAAIGADLEKTRIGAATALDIGKLQKDLAIVGINSDQQKTDLANTLTANVALANIKAGVDVQTIKSNESVMTTQTLAKALTDTTAINASVARASIDAASAANMAALNKKSCGLFSVFTGC